MSFVELLIIAIGLAMDAFAVSISKGLSMQNIDKKAAVTIAFFFGFFQMLMPALGWLLGSKFSKYINEFDHWVAFILLCIIGIKTIVEAVRNKDGETKGFKLDIKELLLLAVATSIDALIVGVTFAFLNVAIISSVLMIGIITFIICFFGIFIGHRFGKKFKKKAEILGGIILILIGLKILFEHLGIINF